MFAIHFFDALISTSNLSFRRHFFSCVLEFEALDAVEGRREGKRMKTYVSWRGVVVCALLPGASAGCRGASEGVRVMDGERNGRVASCHLMRAEVRDIEGGSAGELCSC